MMKNEYTWVCQDTLVLLERRRGEGVCVEQNVLANTEPIKKKLKPLGDGSKMSEPLDLGKA